MGRTVWAHEQQALVARFGASFNPAAGIGHYVQFERPYLLVKAVSETARRVQ